MIIKIFIKSVTVKPVEFFAEDLDQAIKMARRNEQLV